MIKHIKFNANLEEHLGIIPSPKPSKKYIPDWIKSKTAHTGVDFDEPNKCMPFMDSFMYGYTQELICDIEIFYDGKTSDGHDQISYRWAGPYRPMSTRLEEYGKRVSIKKMDGFYYSEQHWNSFWEPETPKGYSTIYTHPLNRPDLPFYTFSGVIETDQYNLTGPIPFLIKNGFSGVIPAGTPIYQIFFVKREGWESSESVIDKNKKNKMTYLTKKLFSGGYKKYYWSRRLFQ